MTLRSKSLRVVLLALLVAVCVAQTATARERGGRRGKKSSGGGYSSASYYPQPTPAYQPNPAPTPAPAKTTPAVLLSNPIPASSTATTTSTGSVDLVLEDLKLSSEATPVAGPAYSVRFRNQGTQPAGKFAVLVAATVDGKLTADAPRAAVEMPDLGPGESREVTLRLPATANQPNAGGQSFHRLMVTLDPLSTVRELDETNNTAVVDSI
jgi:pyruvate dehydrogenase E2 component (dihydrolipoamide acetyltransferase)